MNEKTPELLPEIRKVVILDAPIEKVWKAASTSEGIAGWWMPNTFKAEAGQQFVLHAAQFGDSPCRVTAISPPNRLEFDWDNDWHVTFELKELKGGKTEFTLIHSGWDAKKKSRFGQPYSSIRPVMEYGWEKIVKVSLVKYVAGK